MATFVLVHGGWSGGWVWRDTAEVLGSRGHRVLTPTLTGFGERGHLLSRDITFATFVQDVTNVLAFEEVEDVTLVAHSINGPVAQVVAAENPARVGALVLLDSFLARDGERTLDAFDPAYVAGLQAWVDAAGEGWFVPRLEPELGSVDASEGRGRHGPMPWLPYLEPVRLDQAAAGGRRAFVLCTEKDSASLVDAAIVASSRRARELGWEYRELASGHVPMWTMPQQLAELLENLSRPEGSRSP